MKLDYNIQTATERCEVVSTMNLETLTPAQLEKVANYILYGKDPKGEPLPEAKQISTKHSSYKRKAPESLDALMENVTFDETTVKEYNKRSPYTNPKPTISREHDGDIPGMVDLWEIIDRLVDDLSNEESINGKSLKSYYLRHQLIDLRKDQYHLKELFKPQISFHSCLGSDFQQIDWNCDSGYANPPLTCSLVNGHPTYNGPEDWEWHTVATHNIDLTNPIHIYHLLDNYSSLKSQCYDRDTHTVYLLYAVEYLIEKTDLSPIRKYILIRKIDHAPNDVLNKELFEKFGVSYATNYLSTIWTKEICKAIAETAKLDEEEWQAKDKPELWKTCTKCHKRKLRTTQFFSKKSNTYDKLSPICKSCKKEVTK